MARPAVFPRHANIITANRPFLSSLLAENSIAILYQNFRNCHMDIDCPGSLVKFLVGWQRELQKEENE